MKAFQNVLEAIGNTPLTKFHSDEWMKENRFLDESQPRLAQIDYLLSNKSTRVPSLVHMSPSASVSFLLGKRD